jgi:transmembrane sensor
MKDYAPSPDTLALFETAGDWLARREDSDWLEADEQAFQAWLQQDPAHAQAFARVSRTWQAAAQLESVSNNMPAAVSRSVPDTTAGFWQHLVSPGRMRTYARMALTVCILVLSGGYWYGNQATYVQTVETALTQPATYNLPDGSVIAVNRNSQLAITYYPWRREVRLQRGEAFFNVASTGQSFTVASGNTDIRVVGTAFNVDMSGHTLAVAVEHGKVEVKADRATDTVVMLVANDTLTVDRDTGETEQATLPQQAIGSWRLGRLVLRNTRLDEVAIQLSRYRSHPVEVVDRVLAHRKISGVVNTADPDAFLDSLSQLVHARVIHAPDGRVLIDQR